MSGPHHQPAILNAVQRTGDVLAQREVAGPIRLVIAGVVAGLLSGSLRASRITADFDVLWHDHPDLWQSVVSAAAEIAAELDLPPTWFNKDCSIDLDSFPLGWADRVEPVGQFGPLDVHRVSRFDLIASKVVSSPRRPQDLADLHDLAPTSSELDRVSEHLDRLASEHLDGHDYPAQRAIIQSLRERS